MVIEVGVKFLYSIHFWQYFEVLIVYSTKQATKVYVDILWVHVTKPQL